MDELKPLGEDESVEELLSSIRRLVYPAYDKGTVIDLNRPVQEEPLLSSHTVNETHKVMTSFRQAVEQKVHSEKTLESFVAQLLAPILQQEISRHEDMIFSCIERHVHTQLTGLLTRWLDTHLPALVAAEVQKHLETILSGGKR